MKAFVIGARADRSRRLCGSAAGPRSQSSGGRGTWIYPQPLNIRSGARRRHLGRHRQRRGLYGRRQGRERRRGRLRKSTAEGAGEAARLCECARRALHPHFHRLRLRRPPGPALSRGRSRQSAGRLWPEQAQGRNSEVALANPRSTGSYAPRGSIPRLESNFVKTMLRLGASNDTVRVVDDQIGSPTSALDIADAILAVARQQIERPHDAGLRGIFHMTGAGEGSWADFAEEIFASAESLGRSHVKVRRITTAEYPTAAARPGNSRLDNRKFAQAFGFALPDWRKSTRACVARLLAEAELHRKG